MQMPSTQIQQTIGKLGRKKWKGLGMALGWANERKQAIGPLGIGQRNIFFLGTFQSHEKQFSRED